MPICTLFLLSISSPLPEFLTALSQSRISPLVVSKVVRWIITPTRISVDPLLEQDPPWDLLLIYEGDNDLPDELRTTVRAEWRVRAGVPSAITRDFAKTNQKLLHPEPQDVVPVDKEAVNNPKMAQSAQSLELSPELQKWVQQFGKDGPGAGAVSMLNLLAFKPGKKTDYLKYGKAFAESIGSRHGGYAKIVGSVVDCSSSPEGVKEWDEIALAHYPSINHFAAMLASKDYQEVNHKYRVPSLEDTFILCTSELALPTADTSAEAVKAKL